MIGAAAVCCQAEHVAPARIPLCVSDVMNHVGGTLLGNRGYV